MASSNPFDLVKDDDCDDPSALIAAAAAQQHKGAESAAVAVPKKGAAAGTAKAAAPAAKLPTKPVPPAQAVRDGKNDASCEGGRGGFNHESFGNEKPAAGDNGFSSGNRSLEDKESGRPFKRHDYVERRDYGRPRESEGQREFGGPRGGFRGGCRGGFSNGETEEGNRPRRPYECRKGTARGNEFKKDGAGHGNWGTATDEIPRGGEEPLAETETSVVAEKLVEEEQIVDVEEDARAKEPEEKEPEEKQMTLEEYEKVLEQKRKALLALKAEERKIDLNQLHHPCIPHLHLHTSMSLIAGSYERFIWGFHVKPNSSQPLTLTLTQLFSYPSHISPIKSVALSFPIAASAASADSIKLYDLSTNTELGSLLDDRTLSSTITSLEFYTPSSSSFPLNLISSDDEGNVSIHDTDPFILLKTVRVHRQGINDMAVHWSGRLAVTVGRDECFGLVNLVRGRRSFVGRLGKEATVVGFGLDGERFWMGMGERVSVHQAQDAKLIWEFECKKRVLCAAAGENGLILTGGEDRGITAWDTRSGKSAYCIEEAHSTRVKGIVVLTQKNEAGAATDPYVVASASTDGVIRVWDVRFANKEKPNPLAEAQTKSRLTCLAVKSNQLGPSRKQTGNRVFMLKPHGTQKKAAVGKRIGIESKHEGLEYRTGQGVCTILSCDNFHYGTVGQW
ncbi:p21-activated protein kinase-interacting protein 1-like-like protein [Drosera capensis]